MKKIMGCLCILYLCLNITGCNNALKPLKEAVNVGDIENIIKYYSELDQNGIDVSSIDEQVKDILSLELNDLVQAYESNMNDINEKAIYDYCNKVNKVMDIDIGKYEELIYTIKYTRAVACYEDGRLDESELYFNELKESDGKNREQVGIYLATMDSIRKLQGIWTPAQSSNNIIIIKGDTIQYINPETMKVITSDAPIKVTVTDNGFYETISNMKYHEYIFTEQDTVKDNIFLRVYKHTSESTDLASIPKPIINRPDNRAEKVLSPAIGMTSDEVEKSTWGKPKKINKTTYSWGVKEQWVYSNYKYIYLEDGVVTAIQE